MREKLDGLMGQFKADDYSVKFASGVASVVPFAPKFHFYGNLADAARSMGLTLTPEQLASALALASTEDVEKALWVADALDTGDKGIAVYSGLRSAYKFFVAKQERKEAFETDPQQTADAGLKALGLAYMIHKLFPGDVKQKLELFKSLPAGQGLTLFYASVDVALPFADNLLTGGGSVMQKIMDKVGKDGESKLASLVGGASEVSSARQILDGLASNLDVLVTKVSAYTGPIVAKAKETMPSVLETTDQIAGAVATGADLLPMYRLLGSRLAAEAVVLRVTRNLG